MADSVGSSLEDAAWHTLPVDAVLDRLSTDATGLRADEAARRLSEYGANELEVVARASPWRTFAAQFRNVLIVILLAAALLSGLLGHAIEASAIAVIVLFAVLLGFIQEFRAERALEALRVMAAPVARALRNGAEVACPVRDLVPGDVVLLRAGDRVPADGRLTTAANLAVDEASLTGESAPVDKTTEQIDDRHAGSATVATWCTPAPWSRMAAGRPSSSRLACGPSSGASAAWSRRSSPVPRPSR